MEELFQKNIKKQNILLVDDDADDRELFSEALAFVDPTIQIETKADGEQLMDHLLQQETLPDIIFLDLNMPKKNGKECLVEIRNHKKLHSIPVIIYTTSLNPSDIEDTYNQGAHLFFRKPNSFEELKEILHKIMFSETPSGTGRNKEGFVLTGKSKITYKR